MNVWNCQRINSIKSIKNYTTKMSLQITPTISCVYFTVSKEVYPRKSRALHPGFLPWPLSLSFPSILPIPLPSFLPLHFFLFLCMIYIYTRMWMCMQRPAFKVVCLSQITIYLFWGELLSIEPRASGTLVKHSYWATAQVFWKSAFSRQGLSLYLEYLEFTESTRLAGQQAISKGLPVSASPVLEL